MASRLLSVGLPFRQEVGACDVPRDLLRVGVVDRSMAWFLRLRATRESRGLVARVRRRVGGAVGDAGSLCS